MDGLKAGIKTTEFWLTALTGLATVAGNFDPRIQVVLASLTGIYTIGRSLVKAFQK